MSELMKGDWPSGGRVGRCTAGTAAGSYILLWRENYGEWWTFYLSEPTHDTGEIDGYVNGDSAMAELIRDWGVEWLPANEDTVVEREVFGARAQAEASRRRRHRLRWLRPWRRDV